jgi:hypothetical protein
METGALADNDENVGGIGPVAFSEGVPSRGAMVILVAGNQMESFP